MNIMLSLLFWCCSYLHVLKKSYEVLVIIYCILCKWHIHIYTFIISKCPQFQGKTFLIIGNYIFMYYSRTHLYTASYCLTVKHHVNKALVKQIKSGNLAKTSSRGDKHKTPFLQKHRLFVCSFASGTDTLLRCVFKKIYVYLQKDFKLYNVYLWRIIWFCCLLLNNYWLRKSSPQRVTTSQQ